SNLSEVSACTSEVTVLSHVGGALQRSEAALAASTTGASEAYPPEEPLSVPALVRRNGRITISQHIEMDAPPPVPGHNRARGDREEGRKEPHQIERQAERPKQELPFVDAEDVVWESDETIPGHAVPAAPQPNASVPAPVSQPMRVRRHTDIEWIYR